MSRLAHIFVAAALAIGVMTAPIGTQPAQAAAKTALTSSPAKPIRAEKFIVSGKLSTALVRPVVLQRKSGKKWKTAAAGKTDASGRFALSASTTSSTITVRVVAKKTKQAGKRYRAIISSAKKITTTATQTLRLSAPSPSGVSEPATASVRLEPARAGRPVQLQLSSASGWTTVATGAEDGNGTAGLQFSNPVAGTYSYRAVSPAWNGAPSVTSNTVQVHFVVRITQVSDGGGSGCALNQAGVLKCWGYNDSGEVGDGTADNRLSAVAVAGLNDRVSVVSTGGLHTCAVTVAGAAFCWGDNDSGELGLGTTESSLVPRPVAGLGHGVRSISNGMGHTCALTTAGAVLCWGENMYGQLGDGTTTDRSTPVAVSGLTSGVSAISAGKEHTCAVLVSGAVKCWGQGSDGELGDGKAYGSSIPVSVTGISSGATSISAGWSHTCAVVGGQAMCWGENGSGQLGDSTTIQRDSPVSVAGLGTAVEVGAGYAHTCVREQTGRVRCWGSNYDGKLGDNSAAAQSSTPITVVGMSGVAVGLSVNYNNSCVVTSTGIAQCWGSSPLGDGTNNPSSKPRTVLGLG